MSDSKPKRRRIKLAIALTSCLLTLLCVEVLLRATGRFPSHDVHSISESDYEKIPGMWEPNQDFVSIEKSALPYHVTINSLGLRGSETTLEPTKTRVLCIGDSFTYGDFVEDNETLPAQIQKYLGPEFEVLNAGVRGTTIVDSRAFLPKMLAIQPNIVVFTYCEPNDLSDLLKTTPSHEQMAKDRKLKSGFFSPVFNTIKDTCLFRLALLARRIWILQPRNQKQQDAVTQDPLSKIPEYVSIARKIRDDLRQRRIPFFFVAFPAHGMLTNATFEGTIDPVLEALTEVEIDGIDPSSEFRASGLTAEELYCLPHDGHPDAKAYEICGRVVADALRAHLQSASSPPLAIPE